jgi:hypothetical protein
MRVADPRSRLLPSRERVGSLLHLELNLSVIWRKQVVEPNGRRGAHQNCHPRIQRGDATDLTGFSVHDKEPYEAKSEGFAFAILGLLYNS